MYKMGKLHIDRAAGEDIQTLGAIHPFHIAKLLALFRQLETDPAKFSMLWRDGYGDIRCDAFNVKGWRTPQNEGYDLWRLKDLGLEREEHFYRVIYCEGRSSSEAHVLGVVKLDKKDPSKNSQDFSYDDLSQPIVVRMLRSFERIRGTGK